MLWGPAPAARTRSAARRRWTRRRRRPAGGASQRSRSSMTRAPSTAARAVRASSRATEPEDRSASLMVVWVDWWACLKMRYEGAHQQALACGRVQAAEGGEVGLGRLVGGQPVQHRHVGVQTRRAREAARRDGGGVAARDGREDLAGHRHRDVTRTRNGQATVDRDAPPSTTAG